MRVRTEAKKQAILRNARDVFLREGYEAASTAGIAAASGVSKATIYGYYPSKEDLFVAVVDDACRDQAASVLEALDSPGPIGEVLLVLAQRSLSFLLMPTTLAVLRMMASVTERSPALARSFFEQGPGQAQVRVARRLQRAISDGELRANDPLLLASQFHQLCQAGLYERRFWNLVSDTSPAEVEHAAEVAVDAFMRANGTATAATSGSP